MRILAVDTTRSKLVAVLTDGEKVYSRASDEGNKKHCALLLSEIDGLLADAGMKISDVDCFGAVVGAGSFTGIRIGVATVNAFAFALKKPLVEVTAFELIAYNKGDGVFVVDAMHGNYYGAEKVNGVLSKPAFYDVGELPDTKRYFQDENDDYAEALAEIVKNKANSGCFSKKLVPLYLRKSQAEREADGD